MAHYRPSKPHLPQNLIDTVVNDPVYSNFSSRVFTSAIGKARHEIVAQRYVENPLVVEEGDGQFTSRDGRTFLHLVAYYGDILFAHELIRLGGDIDTKDKHGMTPLFLACQALDVWRAYKLAGGPDDIANQVCRVERTAVLLVEQHAEVNIINAKRTCSPLFLACRARAWDLVALLVKHGAHSKPPGLRLSATAFADFTLGENTRFQALLDARSLPLARPNRPCPCWSGLLLSGCHDDHAQPYPMHHLCRCKSGKSYAKCCKRRNIEYNERWDAEGAWIQPTEVRIVPMNPALKGSLDTLNASPGALDGMAKEEFVARMKKMIGNVVDLLKDHIDPAFAYALKAVDFQPMPWRRLLSKLESENRQTEFNTAVDRYIVSGTDNRPCMLIEQNAKIGPCGGPLYRTCEGEDCDKMEHRDVDKLNMCSQCKMTVYCSKDCQRGAWKAHKVICGTAEQQEQRLPSQDVLAQFYGASSSLGIS